MNRIHARRGHVVLAVALAASLSLSACGTRLEREEILSAGAGSGASDQLTGGAVEGAETGAPGASVEGSTTTGSASGGGDDGPGSAGGEASTGGSAGAPVAPGDSTAAGGTSASGPKTGGGNKAPGATGSGNKSPIVIATIGQYSGPLGAAYVPGLRALQAWASATNARGGINGRPVKLLVYDDGGNGAKARSQAQNAIEDKKAVAIVGSLALFTVAQWAEYAKSKKVPVIGGDCTAETWNTTTFLFNQCGSILTITHSVAAAGGKYAKSKKWAVLYCAEASACELGQDQWFNKGIAKKYGMDPVYRARVSVGQADFTAECLSAKNASAGTMTVLGGPDLTARVAASCLRQDYRPQFLQVGGTVAANTPKQPGLQNVIAPMGTMPFAGLDTPASREFQQAFSRYAKGVEVNGAATFSWTSGKLFEKAATLAGNDVTPAGLVKGLYSLKNERLGGASVPLNFAPGKPSTDHNCWMTMVAVGDKWTAPEGDKPSCR